MNDTLVADPEERSAPTAAPHLSHSRIAKYLLCPEQYRLYYVEGLRPRFPSASLIFGKAVHQALAALLQGGEDPVSSFLERWTGAKDAELTYPKRDSWESLRTAGEGLLEQFVKEEMPKLTGVQASERPFTLDVSTLDLPFVGIVDLVADVEEKRTVVDFKTSGSSYGGHEARMSDQLKAYRLAEPDTDRAAFCVLVKTKTPKIQWQFADHGPAELLAFLEKAGIVGREIEAGRFFKRPGLWCSWCDFLPVCTGDRKGAEESLVQFS